HDVVGLVAALLDPAAEALEALVLVRADERAALVLHDRAIALLDHGAAARIGAGLPLRAQLIDVADLLVLAARSRRLVAELLRLSRLTRRAGYDWLAGCSRLTGHHDASLLRRLVQRSGTAGWHAALLLLNSRT